MLKKYTLCILTLHDITIPCTLKYYSINQSIIHFPIEIMSSLKKKRQLMLTEKNQRSQDFQKRNIHFFGQCKRKLKYVAQSILPAMQRNMYIL